MITDPRMTANTDPKTIVNTDPRIAITDLEIETEDLVLAVGIDIPEAEGRLRQDANQTLEDHCRLFAKRILTPLDLVIAIGLANAIVVAHDPDRMNGDMMERTVKSKVSFNFVDRVELNWFFSRQITSSSDLTKNCWIIF